MRNIVFITILLWMPAGIASAEIYKWRDENGTIHFSDKPVADQKAEVYVPQDLNIVETESSDSNHSRKGDQAKQFNPNDIQIQKRLSKEEVEEKRRAEIQEMIDKERNRPKSREEKREERRRRKRQNEEMKRRAGIY
jgi:hypothetical protein